MKKKLLIPLALIGASSILVVVCGHLNSATSNKKKIEQNTEIFSNENDIFVEGSYNPPNDGKTFQTALDASKKIKKCSTNTINGKYTVSGVTYTFNDKTATIVTDGTYSMGVGKINIKYNGMEKQDYEITKTDTGFTLLAEGTLLPLVYMSGTNGLNGTELFDGIYSMGNQGYVFKSDGNFSVVISYNDLKVTDDTITFASQNYDYRSEDGKIILSTNGTDVMTLEP